jgi:hypothetical protein
MKTVYIVKYCLTKGIIEILVSDKEIHGKILNISKIGIFHEGDWFLTLSEARKEAEYRKTKELGNIEMRKHRLEQKKYDKTIKWENPSESEE